MTRTLKRMLRRIRYWRGRNEREQLLREEMEFHIDGLARDLMNDGMSEDDARYAARRRFGNMAQQAEDSRGTWISRWFDDAMRDFKYTLRSLCREAGFTTFAILTIALGIGASTTIFSVVNALLLRPLPFKDPSRLVWVANNTGDGLSSKTIQVGHFVDLRDRSQSFSEMAAYFAFYGVGDNKLTGSGEPERISGVPVSQNFFSLLGVTPQIGRTFNAEECLWQGPKAVMLSHGLWTRRFASDPKIVGQKLNINEEPYTVVGVLPETFDFSTVFAPGQHIDLYLPFPLTEQTNRWGNTLSIIGRLKPGVSIDAARTELTTLAGEIERLNPQRNLVRPALTMLEEQVSGRLRLALIVLASAVGVVMLIVCANLSNLQLARTATRQKEMAIRTAIGAGRSRLIRQMLTESVVLSCCGAVLGIILAMFGVKLLSSQDAISIPLLQSVRLDLWALGFTSLVAVATGLLFGLVPALQIRPAGVHDALKDGTRGSSQGRGHTWIRNTLVVSEIAFACVLLVGAGLLLRSFLQVLDLNLGFQPERAAAVRIDPDSRYDTNEKRNAYFSEALRRVKEIPGIEAAGLTDVLPYGRNRNWGIGVPGIVFERGANPSPFPRIVTEGYFRAMGIPMKQGRDFTESDLPNSEPVIILNETLANRLWPGQNPLGRKVIAGGRNERQVIGIVGDVRHLALEAEAGPEMYMSIRQVADYSSVDLVVRTSLPPATLASSVRQALKPIEPNLPAADFRTLNTLVDKAVSPRKAVVLLLGGFAGFALILASLGIYGVISYSVNQRTQEIGIRMALGASAGDLKAGILGQTLGLTAVGLILGVVAAWALSRLLSGLLFGVEAADPLTFAAIVAIFTAVAGVAGYLPARRAAQVDPITALRAD